MMPTKTKSFIQTREFLLPLGLFLLFLAFTLPGIAWGAPSVWHPDEIVVRSINAVIGDYKFSEINFDYPDLPQYAMYWLGKVVLALGYETREMLVAARLLSAVLAGLTVVLTYIIARRIGGSITVAGSSGLFLICVSEMSHNGRFAHNDTYLLFFVTLSVLCLLEYVLRGNRLWLYAPFLTLGMAASSKYIGGSLILAPLTVYLLEQRKRLRTDWLSSAETLFISVALAFLGFALGTPKALTWMAYYFKRLFSTLQWQVNYGYQADSVRGFIGQYRVMAEGLGLALILLFGAGLMWAVWRVVQAWRGGEVARTPQMKSFAVLLLAILALDLPMTISYNYQLRYFLTLMPFLAILTAFFLADLHARAKATGKSFLPLAVNLTVAGIVLYSLARLLSLTLLVMNDARIPASAFMDTLPPGRSLEHTYYPPTYDGERFEREYNYPIYFVRGEEPLPTDKRFEYNAGETGLVDRQTDYFVVDSFTSDKFNDPHYCETMPAECAFFKQLETGRTAHYQLLKEFKYTLPPWLPQIRFEFINPAIRIYERIP
ncbi:MAG: phospholipid carrier-dependent glycosyltransferase [Chloroflexi bacterium]|nr:phospholipid carrier-dependent glycosyltransferase [Chloroflexota bacterium]